MFTEEEKIRTIELYFKYGKKLALVVREPGYPSKRNLRRWIRSWEAGGGAKESIRHKPRYTDEQKQVAVDIILTTAAAWRLPAEPWVIPALMCSLAGLMNFIPADDVYLPV
ncbi:transposase family protein, partial [Escherichia coli p0305293.10]